MMRRREIAPFNDFRTDDIEAADVLLMLHLPRVFLTVESESCCGLFPSWAVKRRRSYGRSMQSFLVLRPGNTGSGGVGPKCEPEGAPAAKAEALSPATPLSFPPSSESDDKPKKDRKRKFPLKRKREEWLVIMDGLTQDRASLKEEIENMRRKCESLRAFNLELKAKLSPGPCLETGKIGAEENKETAQIGQLQPSLPPSSTGFGFGLAHCNMGPSGLPDLNLCAEGTVGIDSYGPFDLNLANKNFSRTMAAQARQRRTLIRRIKKLQQCG